MLWLFKPYVISAQDQFCPRSFLPYVCGKLTEIFRYLIYNRLMALASCKNFVFFFYLDRTYAVVSEYDQDIPQSYNAD